MTPAVDLSLGSHHTAARDESRSSYRGSSRAAPRAYRESLCRPARAAHTATAPQPWLCSLPCFGPLVSHPPPGLARRNMSVHTSSSPPLLISILLDSTTTAYDHRRGGRLRVVVRSIDRVSPLVLNLTTSFSCCLEISGLGCLRALSASSSCRHCQLHSRKRRHTPALTISAGFLRRADAAHSLLRAASLPLFLLRPNQTTHLLRQL